jgi:AsmA protein
VFRRDRTKREHESGPPRSPRRRSWAGRILRGAGVAVVLLAALVLGLLNPPAIAQVLKAQALPRLSASLGRQVDTGAVSVSLLPRPRATIEDVRVAGLPGEPPLLRAQRVNASLALWPLLRSRGKTVEITSLTLDQPEVALVREPGGQWSFQGLGTGGSGKGGKGRTTIESATVRGGTLQIIDRASRPPSRVTVTDIDARARNLGAPGSEALEVRAAAFSDRQNLRVEAQSREESGAERAWTGQVSLSGASLEALRQAAPGRLPEIVRGGQLDLRASFSAVPGGTSRAQGKWSVASLQVGGSPASARSDFTASVSSAGQISASLSNLAVSGPGVDLGGEVELAGSPPSVRFALRGDTLDIGALKAAAAAGPEAEASARERRPPSSQGRRSLAKAEAGGTLQMKRVVAGRLAAEDLNVQMALQNGVLDLSRARARVHGGELTADGTRIDLSRPVPPWSLRAQFRGVDLASAAMAASGKAPLEGRAQGELSLDGAGLEWRAAEPTLSGRGTIAVADAALTTIDLDQQVVGALSGALSAVGLGREGATPFTANQRGTPLHDLSASFTIAGGALQLTRPLHATTDLGEATLGGAVGLDQSLHLSGSVAIQPTIIASLTGGRWSPVQSVSLPLSVGGTLSSPKLELPPTPRIAEALIAQSPIGGSMQHPLGEEMQRQAREGLKRAIPGLP